MFCYVVEGVLMFGVGSMGILLNIFSICFFLRQRTHRTFHRYSSIDISESACTVIVRSLAILYVHWPYI
jgi:Co/Zn/Cd efflux system component